VNKVNEKNKSDSGKKRIVIFDTTLRDGEQSPGASLTMHEKIIIAKQLAKLGVDIIEAGFPISSEGDFESVKLIAQSVKGPTICGLARANKEDIQRAYDAVKFAEKPRIHVFIATSDIHIKKKLHKTREEVLKMTEESVKFARSLCKDIEFSCEDATRSDIDYMCKVVAIAIKAGATTINIPDTVGYTQPEEYANRIKAIYAKVPEAKNIKLSVHCHNDLGMAVANSLAAIKAGVTQVECTINGIGERAGNASLEELVMNIRTRKDYFNEYYTSINTKELYPISQSVSQLTGLMVQRNKAIVGRNAFAHEAGIHQHGVLADKNTYEIMDPEEIGWAGTNIVIGKHSGKHAVEAILRESGYDLKGDQINIVLKKVKELADKQKVVEKEDVLAIASNILGEEGEETIVELDEVRVTTGNKTKPVATVSLLIEGKKKTGTGEGVGPVDAVNSAIKNIIGPSITLKEFTLKAITGGTDALADVMIGIEDNEGRVFKAQGVDEDVIMASAIALVKGINKALSHAKKQK
jgi:2-isopropylmalate synthase